MKELFEQLGLGDKEMRVFLALAETGKATAQALGKKISIPRTTSYSVLANLVEKGLVSQETTGATTFFIPNNPSSILRMIEKEQEHLDGKALAAKEFIKLVAPYFKSKNFHIPKLQFFEGEKNVEAMLYDFMPLWNESMYASDKTWWGYQDPTLLESYTKWLYWSWKTHKEDQVINLFSHKASIERKLKKPPVEREIRVVPDAFKFNSTIWVCGDYIIMIMTREKPHYSFQILDPVFASNLKMIFKLLWNSRF